MADDDARSKDGSDSETRGGSAAIPVSSVEARARAAAAGETIGDHELRNILRDIGLRLAATGPTRSEAGRKLATARRSEVHAVIELLTEDVQAMTGMDDEAASKILGGIIGDLKYILPFLPARWPR